MKRTPRTKKYGPALYLSLPSYKKKLAKQVRDQHAKGLSPEKCKRVRKASKARAKQLREYRKWLKTAIAGRKCEAHGIEVLSGDGRTVKSVRFCTKKDEHPATEYHHPRGRVGLLLLDKSGFYVCREAHNSFHKYPRQARTAGFFHGAWNHLPKEKAA